MLYLLVPLTLVLAFQDWRSNSVNLWVALLGLIVLALGIKNLNLSIVVFSILLAYRHLRPGRIQFVDIATFSLGAGYFNLQFFLVYCLVTAAFLLGLSKLKKVQLPFLVAWMAGFWITFILTKQNFFVFDF